MICPNCGSSDEEGAKLCSSCGAELTSSPSDEETPEQTAAAEKESASAETEPPSPQETAGPPEEETPATSEPPAKSGTRPREMTLFFALIALAIVVAIVLVLVFVVFKVGRDEGNAGAEDSTQPTSAVQTFFKAIETGDVDALISSLDPDYIEELKAEHPDDYRDLIQGFFVVGVPEGLNISITDSEETVDGDQATVTVLSGTVSYVDENGELQSEDITQDVIVDFTVVNRGGKWFVSIDTFPDWWYYLDSVSANTTGENQ